MMWKGKIEIEKDKIERKEKKKCLDKIVTIEELNYLTGKVVDPRLWD